MSWPREVRQVVVAVSLAVAGVGGCGGSTGSSSAGGTGGGGSAGRGGAAAGASGSAGDRGGTGGGSAGSGAAGTGAGANAGAGGSAGIAGTAGSSGAAGTNSAAGNAGAGGGGASGGAGLGGRGGSSTGGAAGTGGRGGSAGAGTAGRGSGGAGSGGAAATGVGGVGAAGTGMGGNPDGGASDGPADVPPCVPTCAGKSCGGDGCGGICATCPSDQHCTAAFTCAMNVANACGPGMGLDPAAPWPTAGRCYARRAAATVLSVQKPVVAWTHPGYVHSPAVVGRDGTIYFGKNVNNTYSLQALRRDGTPAWSVPGSPEMSPTIGADGAIYYTANYADYGQVVAVEPTGTVRWKANIGHTITPVLVGADGTVYATDNNRTLTALNGADGSVRFTRANVSGGDWTTPAMASDGTLYFASGDVTAMTASGTQLWQTPQPPGTAAVSGVALGPDGTLYVPFFGDKTMGVSGGVRALEPATGATRWTVNFADDGEWLPAIAGDGTIYQPGQLALYAIDKSGKLLWVFPVGDYIGGVALGGDGTIYVSCRDENLYALNRDGTLAWTLQVGQAFRPPAIGGDGTLYVEGSAGLMAIGCTGGTCAACVPNCAGRRCGPDGCGSLCGACGAGDRCELATRTCQPIAPPGGAGACGDSRGLQAGAPWPALGVCPTRIGRTGQLGPHTMPSIRWTYTAGGNLYTPPSIAADGTLYFGASDRKLYAVRADGSLRWTFASPMPPGSPPTIAADGTIYTSDGATNSSGYVYAIRPDGSKRWSLRFPFGTPSAPMVGGDGTLYAETYAYVYASRAVAIDPLTGTMRWATYAGAVLQAGPALGFDGSVYVHGPSLFALAPSDGRVLWNKSTTAQGLPATVPVVDTNGNVYAAQDKTLIAFAPDGTIRWMYTPPASGVTGGLGGAPAIGADGSVLQPVYNDSALALAALDPATGAVRWEAYDGTHVDMSPIVDGGGWIYYGANDFLSNTGIIYALDGAGKLQWKLPLPSKVNLSLALGANGVLYVPGADAKLYAVGP